MRSARASARMTGDALVSYGQAAWMAGRSGRETWTIQLREARRNGARRRDLS